MTVIGLIVILAAGAAYTTNRHFRALNTLVLGSGQLAESLMQKSETRGLGPRMNVLGHICTEDCGCALPQRSSKDSTPNLLQILRERNASTILIAASREEVESYTQQLLDCKLHGIKLVDVAMVSSQTVQIKNPDKVGQALIV